MATYNGERFLSEQLQSLSQQTRLPDELVITDDGSCDGTLAILEAFATTSPFPVRIHRNPWQLGYGDNFLRAASLCQSDLIAFADQDDVWMPNKIARCMPFFADREVLLSMHAGMVVDEGLNPLGYQHPRIRCTRVVLDRTLYRRALPGFAMIIRKDLPGLFQTPRAPNLSNSKPMPHDTWAGLLASTFGKAAFIQEALVYYRRHQTTTTTLSSFSTLQQIEMAKLTTADSYSKSAQWAAELITSLNQIQLNSEREQHLRQIAVHGLDRHRQALEQRTQLYGRDKGFLPKLRLFLNLISRGHYGDPQEGNLGWKSLLKDSAHIVQLASPLG
jgi:glycosyltransferase involved in cell wall biosynthesis